MTSNTFDGKKFDQVDDLHTATPTRRAPDTETQRTGLAEPFEAGTPNPMSATERLAVSRARMREAMRPASRQRAASTQPGVSGWLARLENLPGVSTVVSALKKWWSRHPFRPVVVVARETSGALVTPLAQTHPVAMVSAGLVLGALMTWVRPWRWISKGALFAGLMPQIVSSLPIDSWVGSLRSMAANRARVNPELRRTDVVIRPLP